MIVLAASLALLIGLVLGTLGGGGSILMLPMLVYALHVEPKTAIATSLLAVGATSLVGMVLHARAGNVRWRIAGVFGAAAMVGAFGGGRLTAFVPGRVLLVAFATVMVLTATAMMRSRPERAEAVAPVRMAWVVGLGFWVGMLSGLVGAGGGFLIVPALTLFGGLAMREAIGTSLLVIAMQSFAGFAGHVTHVHLDGGLVVVVTAAAMAGSIVGVWLARRAPAALLRRVFAWLVVGMGLFMFAKQLSVVLALAATGVTLALIVFVTRRGARPKLAITTPPSTSLHGTS